MTVANPRYSSTGFTQEWSLGVTVIPFDLNLIPGVLCAQAHKTPFVSLVILWRRAPNGAWEWAVHVSKGHITCDSRGLIYIRCCDNPSRLSDSAKPQFLV